MFILRVLHPNNSVLKSRSDDLMKLELKAAQLGVNGYLAEIWEDGGTAPLISNTETSMSIDDRVKFNNATDAERHAMMCGGAK